MKRDAYLLRIGTLLIVGIMTAAVVMAGEMRKAFRVTVPTVTARITHTFTESDVGSDDLAADLLGAVFQCAVTSATVSVSVITSEATIATTNTITNAIGSVAMDAATTRTWAPSSAFVVSKGDVIAFDSSDTTDVVNVRFWIK